MIAKTGEVLFRVKVAPDSTLGDRRRAAVGHRARRVRRPPPLGSQHGTCGVPRGPWSHRADVAAAGGVQEGCGAALGREAGWAGCAGWAAAFARDDGPLRKNSASRPVARTLVRHDALRELGVHLRAEVVERVDEARPVAGHDIAAGVLRARALGDGLLAAGHRRAQRLGPRAELVVLFRRERGGPRAHRLELGLQGLGGDLLRRPVAEVALAAGASRSSPARSSATPTATTRPSSTSSAWSTWACATISARHAA